MAPPEPSSGQVTGGATSVDGRLLRKALLASLAYLAQRQDEVNRLNVFPVPDGDTGTNMLLTLQSAVEDIQDLGTGEVQKVAKIAAHGSLMGSRGNSGVILSQIFRGFANAVQGHSALDPQELGRALEEAANAAYRAVRNPTEGTILTVARVAGRAAVEESRAPQATPSSVLRAAADAAARAVALTPTQLPVLQEAGVVDAGGYGLQIMLEGMLSTFEEQRPGEPAPRIAAAAQVQMELPEGGWGYCTEFLLRGQAIDVDRLREEIESLGNSALVVGEADLVKVHVHTDDPARVLSAASAHGQVERLSVGDMSSQHRRIKESAVAPRALRDNGIGLVAVASGPGLASIMKALGVDAVVEGGQTMNPSTEDLVRGVESLPYGKVILLPNNANVILAANQVAELTPKEVTVVPTRSMPAGVAALVAFNPERALEENLEAIERAVRGVTTIELTRAVRDSRSHGVRVREGQPIALIDDRLSVAADDYPAVLIAALEKVKAGEGELLTLYRGRDASDSDTESVVRAVKKAFANLEVEVQAGGQEHYPFIVSVE